MNDVDRGKFAKAIETQKEFKRKLKTIIEFAIDKQRIIDSVELGKARDDIKFTIQELTKIKDGEYVEKKSLLSDEGIEKIVMISLNKKLLLIINRLVKTRGHGIYCGQLCYFKDSHHCGLFQKRLMIDYEFCDWAADYRCVDCKRIFNKK